MFFSKILLPTAFALTASAIPQLNPGGSMARPAPTTTSSASISTTTTSASTSASAIRSSSKGSVQIVNNLDITVYLWSTSATFSSMQTIASSETYSETYQANAKGGGISIKMATTES